MNIIRCLVPYIKYIIRVFNTFCNDKYRYSILLLLFTSSLVDNFTIAVFRPAIWHVSTVVREIITITLSSFAVPEVLAYTERRTCHVKFLVISRVIAFEITAIVRLHNFFRTFFRNWNICVIHTTIDLVVSVAYRIVQTRCSYSIVPQFISRDYNYYNFLNTRQKYISR